MREIKEILITVWVIALLCAGSWVVDAREKIAHQNKDKEFIAWANDLAEYHKTQCTTDAECYRIHGHQPFEDDPNCPYCHPKQTGSKRQ